MFRKRLELAREGVRAYLDLKNPPEAVVKFKSYLRILEEWKNVHEGGLTPAHFQETDEDAAELLLVCGVYWDLAKIYDKTETDEKFDEFKGFLDKFVQFSQGQRFHRVSVETMRRYIAQDKPAHKADFVRAFKMLGPGRCFVATSLAEHLSPGTLPGLRDLRDRGFKTHRPGRMFVAWYYRRGPRLARWMSARPEWARRLAARALDAVSAAWSRFVPSARSSPGPCPRRSRTRSKARSRTPCP